MYKDLSPLDARLLFRNNSLSLPTSGFCDGYTQCNLIILPLKYAEDFELFAKLNDKACPVLERTQPGRRNLAFLAKDSDIASDFPKYRVYEKGVLIDEPLDIKNIWKEDFVSFLIGCSFSFEEALKNNGIPIRHNEMGVNVPMYKTNIPCKSTEHFSGNMVVSMRPMNEEQAAQAHRITANMPKVHGAPVHIGSGGQIGINDINNPDFGDTVEIRPGEVCVFWPCGVTPQAAVMDAKPDFAITHAPGYMFICDIKNEALMN